MALFPEGHFRQQHCRLQPLGSADTFLPNSRSQRGQYRLSVHYSWHLACRRAYDYARRLWWIAAGHVSKGELGNRRVVAAATAKPAWKVRYVAGAKEEKSQTFHCLIGMRHAVTSTDRRRERREWRILSFCQTITRFCGGAKLRLLFPYNRSPWVESGRPQFACARAGRSARYAAFACPIPTIQASGDASRADSPTYVAFFLQRGWYCQFLEEDCRTPLPRKLTFKDVKKVVELAERCGALTNLEARQAIDHAIATGRGGMW